MRNRGKGRKKRVYIYHNNTLINEHPSAGEAAKTWGVDISMISRYCNNKIKSPEGYRFTYTEPVKIEFNEVPTPRKSWFSRVWDAIWS